MNKKRISSDAVTFVMSINPDFAVTSFMNSWGNAKFLPDMHRNICYEVSGNVLNGAMLEVLPKLQSDWR
jgi:hypothetical protein